MNRRQKYLILITRLYTRICSRISNRAKKISESELRSSLQKQLQGLPTRSKDTMVLATTIASQSTVWFNTVLATDAARSMDSWIRDTFASGAPSIYDKAMDGTFLSQINGTAQKNVQEALSGIEPYYHRLFDGVENLSTKGGHDLSSAWTAVVSALPDDTMFQEVLGYSAAVAKDLVTPMGLPIKNLDRASFDQLSAAAQDYVGVSKLWVADALSYTATELLGASLGALALTLKWNDQDLENFASIVGVLGVSTLFAANPFVGVVALVGLARTFQRAKLEHEYGSVAHGIAKGGFSSGAFIAGAAALTGPVAKTPITTSVVGMLIPSSLNHTGFPARGTMDTARKIKALFMLLLAIVIF